MDANDYKPFRLLCDVPLIYTPEMMLVVLSTVAKMMTEGKITLPDQSFNVDGHSFTVGIELDHGGEEYLVLVQEIAGENHLRSPNVDPRAMEAVSKYLHPRQGWRNN